MRKSLMWLIMPVVLITALATAGSGGGDKPVTATASPTVVIDPNTLAAKKQAPASLATDDPAWNGAPVMTGTMEILKGTKPTEAGTVAAQALYSDTRHLVPLPVGGRDAGHRAAVPV